MRISPAAIFACLFAAAAAAEQMPAAVNRRAASETSTSETSTADGCPIDENFGPRCYCANASASGSPNQSCDPTQRVTGIASQTAEECAAYCVDQCGEGAGSSFACHSNNEPLMPCDESTTSCKCGCETSTPPSPMQFGGQCVAWCDSACGTTGSDYSCPAQTTSAAPKLGVAIGSAVVAVVVASLAM